MKHIPRFFISKEDIAGDEILIKSKEDIKRIIKVLRLKSKDIVIYTDTTYDYKCKIGSISNKKIFNKIIEKTPTRVFTPKYDITLAIAVPKPQKIGKILQYNTQVGVNSFVFFNSEFSQINIVHLKLDRFKKIIKETCLQCERSTIPNINTLKSINKVLKFENFDHKIILHSRKIDKSLYITDITKNLKPLDKILILIGPEGGFSDQEIEYAIDNNCLLTYLETPILKVETACIAICSRLLI